MSRAVWQIVKAEQLNTTDSGMSAYARRSLHNYMMTCTDELAEMCGLILEDIANL